METIRKIESKIGTNDESSHIPLQMVRLQASSTKPKINNLIYEEFRWPYRPKRCGNNNKDEDNSPKNLNDKYLNIQSYFIDIS